MKENIPQVLKSKTNYKVFQTNLNGATLTFFRSLMLDFFSFTNTLWTIWPVFFAMDTPISELTKCWNASQLVYLLFLFFLVFPHNIMQSYEYRVKGFLFSYFECNSHISEMLSCLSIGHRQYPQYFLLLFFPKRKTIRQSIEHNRKAFNVNHTKEIVLFAWKANLSIHLNQPLLL